MKNKESIDLLLHRNSMHFLTSPAPSDEELAMALQTAASAPDHGKLTPWRFKLIHNEHIGTFTDFAFRVRQQSDDPIPSEKEAAVRAWLSEVPLLIAVGCHIDYNNDRIPEFERTISAGCAVMNVINALHMMGYGVFWSTGIATFLEAFQIGMGFDPLDYRFMGFLCVGTPKTAIPPKERVPYTQFVEEWTSPLG